MTNIKNTAAAEKMFGELLPLVQTALDAIDKEFGEVLINDVFNRVYGREEKLDIKTRELCTVSMLSALGRSDDLTTHLGVALNLGWTLEEIRECLLLCCIPAGWPAAFDGVRTLDRFCRERNLTLPQAMGFREGYPDEDWPEAGRESVRELLGNASYHELIRRLSFEGDDFTDFILSAVYGKLLSRTVLDERTRYLILIASFAALKSHLHLKLFIEGALGKGLNPLEIREVLFYCCIYAGQEATFAGLNIYRECTDKS